MVTAGGAGGASISSAIERAPSADPMTKISSMPVRFAASRARSRNGGKVTRKRAPASRSWPASSSAV
jgi:hypothetical protein